MTAEDFYGMGDPRRLYGMGDPRWTHDVIDPKETPGYYPYY